MTVFEDKLRARVAAFDGGPGELRLELSEARALADAVALLRRELAWRVGDTDMGVPAWDLQQALACLDAA